MVDALDLESSEKLRESSSLSIRMRVCMVISRVFEKGFKISIEDRKKFATRIELIIIYKGNIGKKCNREIIEKKEDMKYAIAQTSGKQFLLKPGQWYDVDFIKNGNLGDFIYLNKILFFRKDNKIQLGKPFLLNSQLPAKIVQQVKGKKITVLKTKPKKNYTRTRGHRQSYTRVQIDSLN